MKLTKIITGVVLTFLLLGLLMGCNATTKGADGKPSEVMTAAQLNGELFKAIITGDITSTTNVLNKGADPNAKDMYGRTALMKAVDSNNINIVTLLLNKGADVKAKDELGKTALSIATKGNNPSLIRVLVEAGASE